MFVQISILDRKIVISSIKSWINFDQNNFQSNFEYWLKSISFLFKLLKLLLGCLHSFFKTMQFFHWNFHLVPKCSLTCNLGEIQRVIVKYWHISDTKITKDTKMKNLIYCLCYRLAQCGSTIMQVCGSNKDGMVVAQLSYSLDLVMIVMMMYLSCTTMSHPIDHLNTAN